MVDIDRRMVSVTLAHVVSLCRLSTCTTIASSSAFATHNGLLSFFLFAQAIISHFKAFAVPIHYGLSDAEFIRLKAEFGFIFPLNLRAVLAISLPAAPGFPDWRSYSPLCIASTSLSPLSPFRSPVPPSSPFPRPLPSRLRLHPLPRPCRPPSCPPPPPPLRLLLHPCPYLASNLIFLTDKTHLLCCGFNLSDFFHRKSSFRSPSPSLLR